MLERGHDPHRAALHGAVVLLLACLVAPVLGYQPGPLFNPCQNLTAAKIGDSFTIGLLLMAGVNASAINNFMSLNALARGSGFQGVCDGLVQEEFSKLGARFAVFSARVDRLQMLQVPYADIITPMQNLNASQATMVVVAFRGNIYSDAIYLASANTALTGPGYGFAQSVSLFATFTAGQLQYLLWWGTTCDACGGSGSTFCLRQPGNAKVRTCATPIQACTCAGNNIPAWSCNFSYDVFATCNTGVQVAWDGTDRQSSAFKTGPQIKRLNSMSIVSLFYTVFNFLNSTYQAGLASVENQWNVARGESKAQTVDQNGGVLG